VYGLSWDICLCLQPYFYIPNVIFVAFTFSYTLYEYIWDCNCDPEKSDLEILAQFQLSVLGFPGLLFICWQSCGAPPFPSVLSYVFCLDAWKNSRAAIPIFTELIIWELYEHLSSHLNFHLDLTVLATSLQESLHATLRVSLNIYLNAKYFEQTLWRETKRGFYIRVQYATSVSLTVYEVIKHIWTLHLRFRIYIWNKHHCDS
jgi:hypothetical protein